MSGIYSITRNSSGVLNPKKNLKKDEYMENISI